MLESRELTEQIGWWTKPPSQVTCALKDLKCSEAFRHKAKDITSSSIASQTNNATVSEATLEKIIER